MKKVFLDIETQNTFEEVNSNDPKDLAISVVCVYDSSTEKYDSFLEKDFPKLWPILETADMLVTFNGDHFDLPLLNKYYHGSLDKIKSLDLLVEIRKSLGRRIKLDSIAEATLGRNKSGHGLEAITWWRNGEIDKIIKYCLEDVKITKEVYEYAMKNKHLKYPDFGTIKEIKLDTKDWENKIESNLTLSMPF